MVKKIIILGVALVMIFSLAACQVDELTEYKATAIKTLENYAQEKGQENYSVENWAVIQGYVAIGKTDIDAEADKDGIDAVVTALKQMIDGVYSLIKELTIQKIYRINDIYDYAHDKGHDNYTIEKWATITELVAQGVAAVDAAESMTKVTSAVATAKQRIDEVEAFDIELKNRIKQDYYEEFGQECWFSKHYGIYNGAAVFFILGADTNQKTEIISGVEFSYYNSDWTILVWKDGIFYNLEDIETIFAEGVLTQNDLEEIGAIHALPEHDLLGGLGSYQGLDPEIELEIRRYYISSEFLYRWNFDSYYGIYDGYVIFSTTYAVGFWVSGETIDGLVFSHLTPIGKVLAWKDGQCYNLKEIYDNGYITRADLEEIYLRYNQ